MADTTLSFSHIFSKVQSTLPGCIKSENASPITDIFNSKIPETTKHCIEVAVRNYVTKKIIQGEKTNLGAIRAVTLICIELVRNELSLPTLPVQVLGDSFDALTIDLCEELFTFVESNVSIWKEDTFFSPCKTSVLRMCNDLLRRLSRSQNTVFCGRILLFLARFFPFSERSGLNLISEFNLENVTTFTNVEQDPEEMEEETKEKEGGGVSLDYTLYTKFWSLQDFFRNPPQCFQKAPWKMFTVYCGDVLEAFKSFKLDNVQSRSTTAAQISRSLSTEPSSQENSKSEPQDQYFAKYLTNQKLLDLQFSDANFRRYVLLQILILTQYLTSDIRFKTETLTEEQLTWVRKTEELVFSLLAETPPDGMAFVGTVKHILKRELMWSDWKNNGCPDIKGPNDETDKNQNGKKDDWDAKAALKKRGKKRLGEIVKEADSKKKFSMGNAEMSRLWNLHQDNLEACKLPERDFVPALETYFNPAIEQLSGKTDVKEQDRLVNDSNFGWRGLRLLANRSPHFFTHSASPIATLPEYLTTMIKKLAKELPSQLSDDMKAEEEEDKEDEKVILEQNDGVKDEEESMEVDGGEDRPEVRAINEEEQKALAKNLVKLGGDKWKALAKKLGFQDDEIEYMETEKGKKGSPEGAAVYMFHLWVENEGEEANKDNLLYTLGGLKMTEIAEGVFT
ncbi:THO complex subunit 1-like [Macrobrachium nipponense]|uniref:THO complex subunit 1-like n=1 Tax=Macrobrachium nipponense TaxID=159736 RepID=UPI0030C84B82